MARSTLQKYLLDQKNGAQEPSKGETLVLIAWAIFHVGGIKPRKNISTKKGWLFAQPDILRSLFINRGAG